MNSTLQTINVLTIIKEAKNAELCRDLELQIDLLKPIWSDFETNPDFSEFEIPVQASLLKICGYFLSNYGRSKSIPSYQERGKDLITNAIDLFEQLGLDDKSAEAKCHMAMCYLREGKTEEAEPYLFDAETKFIHNRFHPMNLQIQIDKMIGLYWNERFEEIDEIICEMNVLMEHCSDPALQAMYHNHVGISYTNSGRVKEGLFHTREAIRFSKLAGNLRFVAKIQNNLGFSYIVNKEFDKAESLIEESIGIFSELGDSGWLGNVLDTKAQLQLAQGDTEAAQKTITQSINLIESTGDATSIVDCLWTQVEIHCARRETLQVMETYVRLINLATNHISLHAAQKFAMKFNDLIYIGLNQSLDNEVKNYKKTLIENALTKSHGKIGQAAEILGVSSASLSQKIIEQFPCLRAKFGLDKRASRNSKNIVPSKKIKLNLFHDGIIKPFDISGWRAVYKKMHLRKDGIIYSFILPEKYAKAIKIPGEAIVCVIKENFSSGKPFVISCDSILHVGITVYEEELNLFYTIGENEEPNFYESGNVFCIGRVVGFCLTKDIKENRIIFELMKD